MLDPSPRDSGVCKIGYVTGVLGSSGTVYGNRYDTIDKCCDKFFEWFCNTGNSKFTGFNFRSMVDFEKRDGFYFGTYLGKLSLLMRVCGREGEINFCSFCGAKVVIENTKRVRLKERTKIVSDGYEESDVKPASPPPTAQ